MVFEIVFLPFSRIIIGKGQLKLQDADDIRHHHHVITLRFGEDFKLKSLEKAEAYLVEESPPLLQELLKEDVHQLHWDQL